MQFSAFGKGQVISSDDCCYQFKNVFRVMKLMAPIILVFCLQVSAKVSSQTITFKGKNVSLDKVFSVIEQQTGYTVAANAKLIRSARPVSIEAEKEPLQVFLEKLLTAQSLQYSIKNRTIFISRKVTQETIPKEESEKVIAPPITGIVRDQDGKPLQGATVTNKKSRISVVTDAAGNFSIAAEMGEILMISFVGFNSHELKITDKITGTGGSQPLVILLNRSVNDLDETVVVAYNKISSRSNVGAVTVVKGDQIQNLPNKSFDKSLQGLVPGLLVTNGTGQPGGGLSNFLVRGISTAADVGSGSTVRNPLIVIDGVPVSQDHFQIYIEGGQTPITNPLAQLSPSDIESISVLKDAAAIALYGSRASNGVLVVKTRRGKTGRPVFNLSQRTDIASQLNGDLEVLNQSQQLDLITTAYRNYDPQKYPTDASVIEKIKEFFPVRSDGSFYPGTDWDRVLLNKNAISTTNQLSVSGGSDKDNYYLSVEYADQNGVVKKTGYERTSFRLNYEHDFKSWLKVGLNSTVSYNVQDYGGTLSGSEGTISKSLSPLLPVRNEQGVLINNFKGGSIFTRDFANPAAEQAYNRNRTTSFRGLNKIYIEIKFNPSIKLTSNFGTDFMLAEAKEKTDPRLIDPAQNYVTGGRIEQRTTRRGNLILSNLLNYDNTWDDHGLNLLIGQEAQIQTQNLMSVAVKGLNSPVYDQLTSPGTTYLRHSGGFIKETLNSVFSQVNYSFQQRYFLTGSIRRDGSSRFGDDKRYGTYWSSGIGWILSSEKFYSPLKQYVNYFKLRGSVGKAGNAGAINMTTRYDILTPGTFQGGTAVFPTTTPGNQDVKWESTSSWNFGIETRFFNDKVSVVMDLYKKKTTDLLYSIPLPLNTGYYSVLGNIGTMLNNGLEISANANLVQTPRWRLNVNANWSSNKNKLSKANSDLPVSATAILFNQEGESFNSFYLRKWAGVDPATGSGMWIDSLGKPNTNFAAAKPEFVGKAQPDGFGSFGFVLGYDGFDLSTTFYYQYGNMVYQDNKLINDGNNVLMNQDIRALDHWREPGDIAPNPKPVLNSTSASSPSTRFLYEGDYLRLQNIVLSYSLPNSILGRFGIHSLRFYVQGTNLFTWTPFKGQDPNNTSIIGTSSYAYPSQKTYSFGLNLNF